MIAGVTSTNQLVARSYDRSASGFARSADQHVYRLLAVPLIDAVSRVAGVPVGPVLDVAAGTGAVGRHFAQTVATDVSIEQLRRNDAPGRVRADAEHLPFRSRSFAIATCGFGINHVADPVSLVSEMARIARIVGVSTWERPEVAYLPKLVVFDVLARRVGRARSAAGVLLDRYTSAVGSVDAVAAALRSAGLHANVEVTEVEVPWPGVDAYLQYRLSMPTSAQLLDDAGLRDEVRDELREALQSLPADALTWRPGVIIGVGVDRS